MIPLRDDIPVGRVPVLTVTLVVVNTLVFLWQVLGAGLPLSVQIGGAIPYEILTLRDVPPLDLVTPPLTILTSMFLHGGFMHIAGNMLFLWIFGNNVEDALGRGRFLALYFLAGIVAALAQVIASTLSGDPSTVLVPMVGASGAIAGVLAAYMILFPRARVLTLVPIFIIIRLIYLPANLFIGLWFLIQLVSAVFGSDSSGVAFVAHIGGFITGWLFVRLFAARTARPALRARRWGW